MITSTSNPRIKQIVLLNQKAKERNQAGVFLVEGIKMFQEAPLAFIQEVFVMEGLELSREIHEKLEECKWEMVSKDVFLRISDTKTPQGILCVMKQFSYGRNTWMDKETPLILLLEDIQDPGNLGTILRTGEGAGVDVVIMSKNTVDIYNPKTIRGTMGSIYRMPFYYVDDIAEEVEILKKQQVNVYAAHLEESVDFDKKSYLEATAFLIGNEGNGLKEETAKLATSYIKIPMAGEVESLNAGIAASLLIYEANRQRRHKYEIS